MIHDHVPSLIVPHINNDCPSVMFVLCLLTFVGSLLDSDVIDKCKGEWEVCLNNTRY
jgi:hypothetical protein